MVIPKYYKIECNAMRKNAVKTKIVNGLVKFLFVSIENKTLN